MDNIIYKEEAKKAAEVLKAGGVILTPTDTVWGLGCDATNPEAVNRIFNIKGRDPQKSLIILLDNENRLMSYVDEVPEIAWQLLEVSEKPVTLVLEGAQRLAPGVAAADHTIGIRICKHPFIKNLIGLLRAPLVSTSANLSGKPAPGNLEQIDPELIRQTDYVYPGGNEHSSGKPSSVIKVSKGGVIQVLRK